MRVLVIEDHLPTAKIIEKILKEEGYACDITCSGTEGFEDARHCDYDLLILDIMLQDINGYNILRRLRAVQVATPVLILSGLSDVDDKIKGLVTGADDYLTKPFNRDELKARVRAIIRRSKGHSNSIITVGKLQIDTNKKSVSANGVAIRLTSREYAILELLGIRQGATLSKETFLNHLYGGMEEPEFKIIDVFVCKLRKKLANALNNENYISTIWGRGYVLQEPLNDSFSNHNDQTYGQSVENKVCAIK